MTEMGFRDILSALCGGQVEFILIGGLAAMAHGSSRATVDFDVVYSRSLANMRRIEQTLEPHAPYLRGAPLGLPFRFDAATISSGLNFTLRTSIGDLDLLGEVAGGGDYERLLAHSEAIAELETLQDELGQ